jgi:hypothetical protein
LSHRFRLMFLEADHHPFPVWRFNPPAALRAGRSNEQGGP